MQYTTNASLKKSVVNESPAYDLDGMSVKAFKELLAINPGHVVLKLGAEWCGPCKKIESHVNYWFSIVPNTVSCHLIDIDESFELYATFKTKRQINGIPAILCFRKGNLDVIPDFTVTGSAIEPINTFFQQILAESK
jgi:thiol-disulfide isomerase/thioredoxin